MKSFPRFAMMALCCCSSVQVMSAVAEPVVDGGSEAVLEASERTPEEEIQALQEERKELIKSIRASNDRAMLERQRGIRQDPEMGKLQDTIEDLEKQLTAARNSLRAKMQDSGIKLDGAPQEALDGMQRMREIDARTRVLMQKAAEQRQPSPTAPEPEGASPEKAVADDGGAADLN